MKFKLLAIAAVAAAAGLSGPARADTFSFVFEGTGVQGAMTLDYGPATDATYPNAYVVTGVSGTITDTRNGPLLVDAPILGLIPNTFSIPHPTNLLAPASFSRFPVANGLPPPHTGTLSYDNLFWPGGSPQTASDYPPHGGFLDIYGLMVDLGNGRVANFWSNGEFNGAADYGLAVANASEVLDYIEGGLSARVAPVPEPATYALMAVGLLGLLARRRVTAA